MRNKIADILYGLSEHQIQGVKEGFVTDFKVEEATDEIMRLWVEYADCLIKDSQEKDARITDLETRVKEAVSIIKTCTNCPSFENKKN